MKFSSPTLNSGTGALTGTPGASGTFNFTVQVTDGAQGTTTKAFSLTINAALAVAPAPPIPTLGELAVALLALLLAMGAAARLRKNLSVDRSDRTVLWSDRLCDRSNACSVTRNPLNTR